MLTTIFLSSVVILLLAGGLAALYNRLVRLKNRAAGAWADIAVQLKRRHDLVANLVETVKGYAAHERETLEQVVAARNRAVGASDRDEPAAAGQAEGLLTAHLRSLFALAESYPQLRASENFKDLQRSLEKLESEIQHARRYYNAVVRDLNTRIQSVPDMVVARSFGFREREFFELADPSEEEVPRVSF